MYINCMLCYAEQSYRSALSQINDIRRKKALLHAHSELAKETVMRMDEFTKQIRHRQERLAELRRCVNCHSYNEVAGISGFTGNNNKQ